MTGDPEDAADMAQEAFIKAYSSLSGYRGDSKFSVWLYRIVSNVCLDFLRAKKRRQTVSLSVTDDDGEDTELDIADESKSPERIFERAMTRDAVRRGLAALTPEYRQILIPVSYTHLDVYKRQGYASSAADNAAAGTERV